MASQGLVHPAADGKHGLLRSVLTPLCAVITISLNTHPKGALLPHLYCHGMAATRLSGSSRKSGGRRGIRIYADEIDAATVHPRVIR